MVAISRGYAAERRKLDTSSVLGHGDLMIDLAQHQILHALFCLSRDTRHISATSLAAVVGLTPTQTASALVALEAAQLVDASRARLTMLGLATAVRLGPANAGGQPRQQPSKAIAVPVASPAREPLAAKSVGASRVDNESAQSTWLGHEPREHHAH